MSATRADRLKGGRTAAALTPSICAAMDEAAKRALLPRFRNLAEQDCTEKSSGEVVTVADRECEAILSESLSRLLPSASVVGEESTDSDPKLLERLGDDLCWIIDPLDGTGYFAAGQEPFGIMIALASGGATIGGWVLDPLSGRMCWAAAGQGAWIDERRISVEPLKPLGATIGLSSLFRRRPERFQLLVARLKTNFSVGDIPRCAASHYPAMLLGKPELTLFERTLPWDHAPGVLLIEEAGGRAARLDGTPYRVDDDRTGLLVATQPALWEEAARILTEPLG